MHHLFKYLQLSAIVFKTIEGNAINVGQCGGVSYAKVCRNLYGQGHTPVSVFLSNVLRESSEKLQKCLEEFALYFFCALSRSRSQENA